MRVIRTIEELRKARSKLGRLALVPTMGALHAGHMSLVDQARQQAPDVAVSIFVNPAQFGIREDLSKYPRPLERDLAMCKQAGVSLVFVPDVPTMYPPGGFDVSVTVPRLAKRWEGERRPTHFAGVCLVVAKLFNLVQPQVAVFGEKDFQQLAVVRAMTRGLDFPIEIVGCPIVREPDGLAMSSRNVYLTPLERERATFISKALFATQKKSYPTVEQAEAFAEKQFMKIPRRLAGVPVAIDYLRIVEIDTLEPAKDLHRPRQLIATIKVGSTFLLDNVRLG